MGAVKAVLFEVAPGDTDKHPVGMYTRVRIRLDGVLIWVAKGDSCRIPSCVTLLPDTFGGTSETWLGLKGGLRYGICGHLTYAVRPLAAAREVPP